MFKILRDYRYMPLAAAAGEDAVVRLAAALLEGGLPMLELRLRTHSDTLAVKAVRREFPDFWVGVSGVLNRDLLLRAIDAGARFAFSPGVNAETIREAAGREFQFAPGVCTPSDIENAILNGAVNMQFYPASAYGGAAVLKAIIEPFEHLHPDFMAKGGITPVNAAEYLRIPQVAGVCAEWIAPAEILAVGDWRSVANNARAAVSKKSDA